MDDSKAPVIIKKVVKGHGGGHHGGAWKVAYADFVTAMMALFIVLWLMNADEQTRQAVSVYFNNPRGRGVERGTGVAGSGEALAVERQDFSKLKQKIEEVMRHMPEMSNGMRKQVQMTVTGEGLRIELIEDEIGVFFSTGDARPTDKGRNLLNALAGELTKLPNKIMVEGHTDARPFAKGAAYTNWELSTDRANAARRTLEEAGVPQGRIRQVRGYADQQLRLRDDPHNPSNRRVSLVVEYLPGAGPAKAPAPVAHAAAH
jgi:chemotaxis protein MotB